MKQSPELEALTSADDAGVSNKNAKRNQTAAMAVFLLASVAMAYFILKQPSEKPHDLVQDDEEFSTTLFRPPLFVRDQDQPPAAPEPNFICIPPSPQAVTTAESDHAPAPGIVEEFADWFNRD